MNPASQSQKGERRPEAFLSKRGGSVEWLRVPAVLYGAVTSVRTRLYDLGLLPSVKLDVPVISVGNLTTGGTGKTPFVLHLVRELTRRGLKPGILSRGYGAKDQEGSSDEARMLRASSGGVPHIEDPDRVAGGRELERLGVDVVVLDDGFQHRRLRRDLDLVLVDATRPFGLPRTPAGEVRALLPRGLLREPPAALERAHAIVLTRSSLVTAGERERLCAELQRLAPAVPLLVSSHRAKRLTRLDGGTDALPSALRGRTVDLVSGIGNPEAFEASVAGLGASVRVHRSFGDHHDYAEGDLDGLGGGSALVTTAKDAVKLESLSQLPSEVFVLDVELELDEGAAVLEALLDSLPRAGATRANESLHEGLHG